MKVKGYVSTGDLPQEVESLIGAGYYVQKERGALHEKGPHRWYHFG